MKKIIYLVSVAMLLSLGASAQHAIRANRAVKHIGEKVVVVDSIYNIRIYNDSTAVVDLGARGDKGSVNVLFNFNSKSTFSPALLQACKGSLLEVTGYVVLLANQPSIVVSDKDNLYFYSNHISQNGPAISQLPYKQKN